MSLLAANGTGALIPINCIVEEDIADDFKDMLGVGDTAEFDINRTMLTPVTEPKKKALGKGAKVDPSQKSGNVTELIVAAVDAPIEEPEELTYEDDEGNVHEIETKWMNPKAVKAAIKVREAMLEELKKNPPKKSSKPHFFCSG